MSRLPREHTGPALVDLQLFGYAGVDFNGDPSAWTTGEFRRVAEALRRRGVAAVFPTLTTDDTPRMIARARRLAELTAGEEELSAMFPRLHVEGPFLSPVEGPRGAHAKDYLKLPAGMPALIDRLNEACGGRIGILTLAPELPGALDLIRQWSRTGVCVALGHTQASNSVLAEAAAAGARLSTHLGNGCHRMLPGLDNYIETQLADDRLQASFIADGHHLPFGVLRNLLRAKMPSRSILISDATAAAEMPPGSYRLGEFSLEATPAGMVTAAGEPNFDGSAVSLDRAVINVCQRCDVPFARAWAMASTNPCRLIGLPGPPPVTVQVGPEGFRRV